MARKLRHAETDTKAPSGGEAFSPLRAPNRSGAFVFLRFALPDVLLADVDREPRTERHHVVPDAGQCRFIVA